mgnify:CR=1 FL=1
MTLPDAVRYQWRDFNARSARSVLYVPSGLSGIALAVGLSDLELLTRCNPVLIRRAVILEGPNAGNGVAGAYATRLDTVEITFRTASGPRPYTLALPGPREDIWLADGQTLNTSNVSVSDYITWALGNQVDPNGGALLSYVKGVRGHLPTL